MKQRLLKTIGLALLMVVGASNAWAKIVWPTAQIQYRTSNVPSSANAWNENYPANALKTSTIEVDEYTTDDVYMWVIQEFTIPDIDKVTSIKLSYTYSGSNNADTKIFLWNSTYPAAGSSWNDGGSTFCSNVNTTKGGSAFATITSTNTTITLTSDQLSTLKTTFGSTGEVSVKFLLYNATNDKKAIFHGGSRVVMSQRPHLEVTYSDITYAIVNNTTSTGYSDLATAAGAASDGDVLTLYDDCFLNSRLTFNSSNIKVGMTFQVAANRDVAIYKWANFDSQTILNGLSKTLTFDGSNSGASLTIDNGLSDKNKVMFQNENGSGTIAFKNVTIKDYSSSGTAVLYSNNGKYTLENVTFNGCKPSTAIIHNTATANGKVILKGNLTFTDCTVKHIYTAGRMGVEDDTSFNPSTTVNIETSLTANSMVIAGSSKPTTITDKFNVTNDNLGLMQSSESNHTNEIFAVQAYTLNVTDAGAATLVLPFESTIPTTGNLKCYNLTYPSGGDNITASQVETADLDADKAVLVTADEGKYKFVCTSIAAAVSKTGQTDANGVLIGNYDADKIVPGNDYILSYKNSQLGFRKADGSTNKVQGNRAYMHVTHTNPNNAPAFFNINFGGITGISNPEMKQNVMEDENAPIYNLQGVRMNGQNLPKGIYVKNGRKFIVK